MAGEEGGVARLLDAPSSFLAYDPVAPSLYASRLASSGTPLVIDNGSYECRAGWAEDASPRLRFRSRVAVPRQKKQGTYSLVGHRIPGSGAGRLRVRTPFEAGVVTNLEAQERLLDYVFEGLGLEGQSEVAHPVAMTEPLLNPNYCRARVSELLFEGYGVPSVAYGVDALFALRYNLEEGSLAGAGTRDALVVSSSHEATLVLPVLDGRPALAQAARLSVGGATSQALLRRTLRARYPQHAEQFTDARAEELVHRFCGVAPESYMDELRAIERAMVAEEEGGAAAAAAAAGRRAVEPVVVQLPFDEAAGRPSAEEEAARAARRAANAERLRAMAVQRSREKYEELRQQAADFEAMLARRESGELPDGRWEAALERGGFDDEDDFMRTLAAVRARYASARRKREGGDEDGDGAEAAPEEKTDAELYPLVDVPDDELDEAQLKEKRRQRLMKGGADARRRKREEREAEQRAEAERRATQEARARQDGPAFLAELRAARDDIRRRQAGRQQARDARRSGAGDRRSGQARKRMRTLATMGHTAGEDRFGANDDDWDVYRAAAGAGESDSEEDRDELEALEKRMAELFPDEMARERGPELTRAEKHQVTLRVDRRRAAEALFQPHICGIEEAGVGELVGRCLARLDAGAAARAAATVLVTGGNARLPGLRERVENELRAARPFGEAQRVERASDPSLDAWRGARLWSAAQRAGAGWITRAAWDECGAEYLAEHACGNAFVPTPEETEEGRKRRRGRR